MLKEEFLLHMVNYEELLEDRSNVCVCGGEVGGGVNLAAEFWTSWSL